MLDEQSENGDAVVFLSELYERGGRDEDLAELLTSQIEAAKARSDLSSELRYQVRLGEIYEGRLKNREKAIETYRAVLSRDANHRGALECLARLYKAAGENAQAADVTDRLLGMSEGGAAVALALELAELRVKLGAPDQAAAALERGLAADPKNAAAREQLRKLYEHAELGQARGDDRGGRRLRRQGGSEGDAPQEGRADPRDEAQRLRRRGRAPRQGEPAEAGGPRPDARALRRVQRLGARQAGRARCCRRSWTATAASAARSSRRSTAGSRTRTWPKATRRTRSRSSTRRSASSPATSRCSRRSARSRSRSRDYKKAQQMYRALLLQKLDESGPIKKAMVFSRLGDIHDKLGEKPKAIQMYERALQTDDKLDEARQKLHALKA